MLISWDVTSQQRGVRLKPNSRQMMRKVAKEKEGMVGLGHKESL